GLEVDENKIEKLLDSKVPFFEQGLEELLKAQQLSGNLSFTTSYEVAISPADVIMLAVGTPSTPEGGADLKYLRSAVTALTPYVKEGAIVAVKSTVPPGTLGELEEILSTSGKTVYTASLPEFLKEG